MSFLPFIVEETQLNRLRDLAEQREVRARAVEASSERIGATGPDLHVNHAPIV